MQKEYFLNNEKYKYTVHSEILEQILFALVIQVLYLKDKGSDWSRPLIIARDTAVCTVLLLNMFLFCEGNATFWNGRAGFITHRRAGQGILLIEFNT